MSAQVNSARIGLLPPRKRAKTDEEKEQRRIERILRNRRAAHASREKKRRHVEVLENYVQSLETNINDYNNLSKNFFSFIDKLNEKGIDLESLGLSSDINEIKNVSPVERPDGLDLTTAQAFKKKKANKANNSFKNDEGFGSDDDSSEDEEEKEDDEKFFVLKHKNSSMVPEIAVKAEPKEDNYYLSPPNSTSPSRLRLNEEESRILNNTYSNLFDDEDGVVGHSGSTENYTLVDGRSTKAQNGNETYIKLEDEEIKFSDMSFNETYHPSSMDVLCEYNSVHHPAVMMVYWLFKVV